MKDAIEQTAAVLMGRRTFEMGDPDSYVGNYEFQVPIFVLTEAGACKRPETADHLNCLIAGGSFCLGDSSSLAFLLSESMVTLHPYLPFGLSTCIP